MSQFFTLPVGCFHRKWFILSFLVACSSISIAQHELYIFSKFKVNEGSVKGSSITIYKEGKKVKTFRDVKKFEHPLDLDANYIVSFEKEGYITKKMSFDTHVPEERKTFPFDSFDFYMTLYPEYDDIRNSIFTQPVGQIRFDQEFDDFNFDKNYAQKVMKEMASVEEKIKEKIAAGIEPDPTKQSKESQEKLGTESGNKLALDAARKTLKAELATVDSISQLVTTPTFYQNEENSSSSAKSIESLINGIRKNAENAKKTGSSSSSKTAPEDILKLAQSVNVIGKDILKDSKELAQLIAKQEEEQAIKKLDHERKMNNLLAHAQQELHKIESTIKNPSYDQNLRDEYEKQRSNFENLRKNAEELSNKKIPITNFLNQSEDITAQGEKLFDELQDLSERLDQPSKDFDDSSALENQAALTKNAAEATQKVLDETEKRKAIVDSLPSELKTKNFDRSYNKVKEESATVKSSIEKMEQTTDDQNRLQLSNQAIVASKEVIKAGEENEVAYSKIQNTYHDKTKTEQASIRDAESKLVEAIQNAEKRKQKATTMLQEENRQMKKAMGIFDEELRKAKQTLDTFHQEEDHKKKMEKLVNLQYQTSGLNNHTRDVNRWISIEQRKIDEQNELLAKQKQVKVFYDNSVLEHEKTITLMQKLNEYGKNTIPSSLVLQHEKSEKSRLKLEKHHEILLASKNPKNMLKLSQDVLLESEDLIAVTASYNAKLQALIDKEERKLAVKHIIEEAHSLAAETTIIANQTAATLEEIDIEVNMLHLLDATRSAKHQAKKANYLTNQLYDEMPLEIAMQTLNQIKSKRHLALSNRNFVREEVIRLAQEKDDASKSIYKNDGDPIIKSTTKANHQTVEVEEFNHNRKEIKQITIKQEGRSTVIYQKVRHAWGGVYYFKNKESISQHNFNTETGQL